MKTPEQAADQAIRDDAKAHGGWEISNPETVRALIEKAIKKDRKRIIKALKRQQVGANETPDPVDSPNWYIDTGLDIAIIVVENRK